jgi:hypothetical protein
VSGGHGPITLGKRRLDHLAPPVNRAAAFALLVSVLATVLFCFFPNIRHRFLGSYLIGAVFVLSISLGALWFVVLQHLVRAGWSVAVRRLAENLSINLLWLWILFVPILGAVAMGVPLYGWQDSQFTGEVAHADEAAGEAGHGAAAEHGGAATADEAHGAGHHASAPPGGFALIHHPVDSSKKTWLSPGFFAARVVGYFVLWAGLAWWFRKKSIEQDRSGDVAVTHQMQWWAPLGMISFALSASLAGFDLLMSLAPAWYSTIFGLYFFAGSVVAFCSAWIVFAWALQRQGLVKEISIEHFHDVGKLLFGFVVFWAYIGYSQYMLIWYGNLPEETVWMQTRQSGGWLLVVTWLLVGHFFIPFLCLMSRFPKRHPNLLVLGALWLLGMHYCDLFWVVVPEVGAAGTFPLPFLDMAIFLGVSALYVAATVQLSKGNSLIPERDPRLGESLHFQNY